MNTLYTFHNTEKSVFKELNFVRMYIDEGLIGSESTKEHITSLVVVCNRKTKCGLKMRLKNCVFILSRFNVLGYIV